MAYAVDTDFINELTSYLFILVCLKRGLPRSAPWIKLPGISTALKPHWHKKRVNPANLRWFA